MSPFSPRPRRSVLFVPASNERALTKARTLACDAVIVDLEDAVAPEEKEAARRAAVDFFRNRAPDGREWVVRINALSTPWGADDLRAARDFRPDAILVPKVDTASDLLDVNDWLDEAEARPSRQIWAMIETARAMLNLGFIAELGRDPSTRLSCLVAGTNDLAKETSVDPGPDRANLKPWLMQMVLAARAGRLDVLDGVRNDFRDLDAFAAECREACAMGFDGKTLIHPAQIEPANAAFAPDAAALAEAARIIEAFARPENAGRGVIQIDGRMVERLHLEQAKRLVARAGREGEVMK